MGGFWSEKKPRTEKDPSPCFNPTSLQKEKRTKEKERLFKTKKNRRKKTEGVGGEKTKERRGGVGGGGGLGVERGVLTGKKRQNTRARIQASVFLHCSAAS